MSEVTAWFRRLFAPHRSSDLWTKNLRYFERLDNGKWTPCRATLFRSGDRCRNDHYGEFTVVGEVYPEPDPHDHGKIVWGWTMRREALK